MLCFSVEVFVALCHFPRLVVVAAEDFQHLIDELFILLRHDQHGGKFGDSVVFSGNTEVKTVSVLSSTLIGIS